MDSSDELAVATVVGGEPAAAAASATAAGGGGVSNTPILTKSAELGEQNSNNGSKESGDTSEIVFFAGNPEVDVSKGVLRLFKDNM